MITGVEIRNYRGLRYIPLKLEAFQVLVGPNASGKTTLLDTINFIRDLLVGGLDAAVYGDPRFTIPPRAADPRDLTWMRQGGDLEIALTLDLPDHVVKVLGGRHDKARYEVAIATDGPLSFRAENFFLVAAGNGQDRRPEQGDLFPNPPESPGPIVTHPGRQTPAGRRKVVSKTGDQGNDYFKSEVSKWNNMFRLGPGRSALANLPEDEDKFPAAVWTKRFLMDGVHRLSLNGEAMRRPAPAGSPRGFQPDGTNLPWVVHSLEEEAPDRFAWWVEHLRSALPDLTGISTAEREADRARYLIVTYKSGLEAPSWLLSDGTLRMLALTLLPYLPDPPPLTLIEEPENGIHPQAVETVVQALQSVVDGQLLCATHSPLLLAQIRRDEVLCFARTEEGAVDIRNGRDHPRLHQWRSALHLGDLLAAGVLG